MRFGELQRQAGYAIEQDKGQVNNTKMKEASLYAPILSGLFFDGHIAHKIADGTFGKKPCDIMGLTVDGRGLILEVKVSSISTDVLDWTLFASHQKAWLEAAAIRNGVAIAAVYFTDRRVLGIWRINSAKVPTYQGTLGRNADRSFGPWLFT